MNRRMMIILAAPPLLLVLALLVLTQLPERAHRQPPAPPQVEPVAPAATTPIARPIAPPPSALPPLDPAAVSSPQATLSSSLRFLQANDEARFRQTLLAQPASQLTADSFSRCRAGVGQAPVTPDWELAERIVQDGHVVVRVRILGKSMTGFHDLRGRWLADALWCLE